VAVTAQSSAAGLGADDPTPTPSIQQQLQSDGAFERIVVTETRPMQLSELVRADLVVEASAESARAFLNDTDIYTDYTFKVQSLIKNLQRPDLRIGGLITVRRASGVVTVDGRKAVSHENGFPLFAQSERYILFLKENSREHVYEVFGGSEGSFIADTERVTPVAINLPDETAPRQPISRLTFFGEMRALLKFASE
jgi:hypothetical protein